MQNIVEWQNDKKKRNNKNGASARTTRQELKEIQHDWNEIKNDKRENEWARDKAEHTSSEQQKV